MENWLEITMNSPELMGDFMAMVYEDDEMSKQNMTGGKAKSNKDIVSKNTSKAAKTSRHRENSWVRKHIYRKKLWRDFLSLNPAQSAQDINPLRDLNCIWIDTDVYRNGGLYNINHVNHIYLTPRGHVKKFTGAFEWCPGGAVFGLGAKYRKRASITNRRIRHMKFREDESPYSYSLYKKMYGPLDMGVL